jgi:hypothetical protein
MTEAATPGLPQPPNEIAPARTNLLELWAPVAALTVGLAYVVGFVVVNSHLERYAVLEFQPVRARYFSAAFLFLVLTGIPSLLLATAFQLNRELVERDRLNRTGRGKAIRNYVDVAALFFMSHIVFVVMLTTVMVKRSLAFSWAPFVYWLLMLIGIAATRSLLKDTDPLRTFRHLRTHARASNELFGLSLLVIFPLIQAVLFGSTIFPLLSPGYGGGGAWLVDAPLHSDSVPRQLRSLLSAPVAVVDRSDKFVRVVACETREGKSDKFIAAEVERDAISALYVREVITLPEFISRCSENRPASQPRTPAISPTTHTGTPKGPP